MLRFLRDLLVEAVWAGALTALALGSLLIGFLLLIVGVLQLIQIYRGHRGLLFGADGSKPSTTSPTGL